MDTQLETFLNTLGDAERAGGRVLHELTELAQSMELRELLKKVSHDRLRASVMAKGHHVNIGALEDALKEGLA